MNNYHELVEQFARTLKNGQSIPLGNAEPKPYLEIAPDAPTVLIFSPHPDDEVIIGGLTPQNDETIWYADHQCSCHPR